MTHADVGQYVKHLEANGLAFVRGGKAIDLIVVDQLKGPTGPCDWIQCYHLHQIESEIKVVCGRLLGYRIERSGLATRLEI